MWNQDGIIGTLYVKGGLTITVVSNLTPCRIRIRIRSTHRNRIRILSALAPQSDNNNSSILLIIYPNITMLFR